MGPERPNARRFSFHYSKKANRLHVIGGIWSVSTRINFGCLVILLRVMPARPAAASPAKDREAGSNIRLNVEMVTVPVTVTDRRGATVLGLARDNFQVFEDRIAQPIVSFSGQDEPCSVGLIFDISGSMRDKLPAAKEATRAFFKTANPKDEAFPVTVSTQPEVHTAFTKDSAVIEGRVAGARSGGRTA